MDTYEKNWLRLRVKSLRAYNPGMGLRTAVQLARITSWAALVQWANEHGYAHSCTIEGYCPCDGAPYGVARVGPGQIEYDCCGINP